MLYSFQGGNDGSTPAGGVVFDKAGNLYGVTNAGGSTCASPGCGVIFQLSPEAGGKWKETILYGFNGTQGSVPVGGAIIDSQGNLYGTTAYGGNGQCKLFGYVVGCGVVYELSPPAQKGGQWVFAVLYNFQGGKDGLFPWGDLTLDSAGNLYGATRYGGGKGTSCDQYFGGNCGTVFKLTPPRTKGGKWTETILHSFGGGTDGAQPNGGLVFDSIGSVYGTTQSGGNHNCNYGGEGIGCGTAFKLTPSIDRGGKWTESVIHRFGATGSADGGVPMAGMVRDRMGRLYGTASNGGPSLGGIVFQLSPTSHGDGAWKELILYGFSKNGNGIDPESALLLDSKGIVYGTALDSGKAYSGTVFRVAPSTNGKKWVFSLVYGFTGAPDGAQPAARLVLGKAGNLYSTTTLGGSGTACQFGCGTVFGVSP